MMDTIKPGDTVWYLYTIAGGDGLFRQEKVTVQDVRGDRVKVVRQFGRIVWVKAKNIRLTN